MKVSHLSTETILIPVQEIAQGVIIDTTGYPVEIALIADATDPATTDWHTATWETDQLSGENDATIIVGPTTIPLTKGHSYRPWVRVTAPTEQPVLRCPGLLRIF